jgi:hypothetical protein
MNNSTSNYETKQHCPCVEVLNFMPYTPKTNRTVTRNKTHKTVDALPSNVKTCIQVKSMQTANGIPNSEMTTLSMCVQCGFFELEKSLKPKLRNLSDNNPITTGTVVPLRYKCQTLWIAESDVEMKPPSTSTVPPCVPASGGCFPCFSSSHGPLTPPAILVSVNHSSVSPLVDQSHVGGTSKIGKYSQDQSSSFKSPIKKDEEKTPKKKNFEHLPKQSKMKKQPPNSFSVNNFEIEEACAKAVHRSRILAKRYVNLESALIDQMK